MENKMETKKLVEIDAKRIIVKNISNGIYNGEDIHSKNVDLRIKPGEEIDISLKKAKQLFRDFPNNWSLVSNEGNIEAEEELKSILVKPIQKAKQEILKVKEEVKTTIKSLLDDFIESIKSGNYTSEKIESDAISLLKVLPFVNFMSAQIYKNTVKLLPGEIGADVINNIRYILVDKEGKTIDLHKQEKQNKSIDKKIEEDHDKEDEDIPANTEVKIKKSRDIDPEEDLGVDSALDELEGEDPEEKRKGKKRVARKMRGDDEDDED
jgi:hypothetical protein